MINDSFREICKTNNWKCTAQRRALYTYLMDNRYSHPNVDTIWGSVRAVLPDVSLDSIYRILADFTEAGLLRKLESGKVYRYDVNVFPHDHFVCNECGKMFDIEVVDDQSIKDQCAEFGTVLSFELEVRGICQECLAARTAHARRGEQ